MSIYNSANQQSPPENHILTISSSPSKPPTPPQPDFGLDSLFGLLASFITAPLYLYATLKGKFKVWDEILSAIPSPLLQQPTLDVGCGRGMVLLKTAQLKKALPEASPAYGIDIFNTADQTGNAPEATYKNAAAMDVVDMTVLHTASFTEVFPFADGVMGLVTANLALHNVKREGRMFAVREMARVCAKGGRIVIVDLYGYFKDHRGVLEELGWTGVSVELLGFKMLYGTLPCQILRATKPE